jgi:hypothetical protein
MMVARMLACVKLPQEMEPSVGEICFSDFHRLSADDEPVNQRFGEARRAHAFLDGLDVIGNAPEFYCLMLEIRDGKSRPGISISRLTD